MAQTNEALNEIDQLLTDLTFNPNGWGPTSFPKKSNGLAFAPFSKGERIGRVADFIGRDHAKVTGKGYGYRDVDDNSKQEFNLVDTTKVKSNRAPTFRGRWNRRRYQPTRRTEPSNKKELKGKQLKYIAQHTRRGKQWRRPRNSGYRRRNNRHTDASVNISADWEVIEQFDLNVLAKMQIQPPVGEDLESMGSLLVYNDAFDKVTSRTAVKLESDKFFPNVYPSTTTSDDPKLMTLLGEVFKSHTNSQDSVSVFCTDELIAQIMVSTRSGFPWDLLLHKIDHVVLIDKSDKSKLHLETVNETAHPLTEEEENDLAEYNKRDALAEEATAVNQIFRQQCLRRNKRKLFSETNELLEVWDPYGSDDEEPGEFAAAKDNLDVTYRYRKFPLRGIDVYVRTEIHALVKKAGKKKFGTVFCFNEWDSRLGQSIEWRPKIDNQKGRIIATELKNNSYKIAKWTAKTLLAGADTMRFGFVSRKAKTDNKKHVILGTYQLDPGALASQVNLQQKNMWGIFKAIVDIVSKGENGDYVLLKDPNRPVLRLYKKPPVGANESEVYSDDKDAMED